VGAVKQWASMGSNQGKPELNTRGENCRAGCQKVGKGRCGAYIVLKKVPPRIYAEHNIKNRKGSFRDVTSDS